MLFLRLFVFLIILAVSTFGYSSFIPKNELPTDELDFITVIDHYASLYSEAENEIQKSSLLTQRTAFLARAKLPPEVAVNWIGKIDEMTTNMIGEAELSIRISDRTVMKTKIGSEIKQTDPLFDEMAKLKVGRKVKFTAHIHDCGALLEESKMTAPDCLVTYSSVEPVK